MIDMTGLEKKSVLEEARGSLKEISALREAIEVSQSIAELQAVRLHELPRRATGNVSDKVGAWALSNMALDEKMNEALCGISEKLDLAYAIILGVEDAQDRTMLTEHYINGKTWEKVAEIIERDVRTCYRRRDIALGIINNDDVIECHYE